MNAAKSAVEEASTEIRAGAEADGEGRERGNKLRKELGHRMISGKIKIGQGRRQGSMQRLILRQRRRKRHGLRPRRRRRQR